jgi:hypothetical protein
MVRPSRGASDADVGQRVEQAAGQPGNEGVLGLRVDDRLLETFSHRIHPGVEVALFGADWYETTRTTFSTGHRKIPNCETVSVELTIYAEGQQPQQVVLTFDVENNALMDRTVIEANATARPLSH